MTNALTQLRELKRHVFGRKSEKLEVVSSGQASLFETELPEEDSAEEENKVQSYKRSKRNGRKPLPKDLPRERVEYEPEETHCECCSRELEKIGEEISEELDFVPASFIIREHVRIKKACKSCVSAGVVQGAFPADAQVVEKGRAGAGLLSHVFVSKYCDHLPLYRQEQIYAREGIELSRSTLCDWVRQGAELLEPIYKELLRQKIRPVAIGRKNYMFAGSHDGAKRAAILYSLINTCKIHKVNPFKYLQDVLKRVNVHPKSRIQELTPQNWTELVRE